MRFDWRFNGTKKSSLLSVKMFSKSNLSVRKRDLLGGWNPLGFYRERSWSLHRTLGFVVARSALQTPVWKDNFKMNFILPNLHCPPKFPPKKSQNSFQEKSTWTLKWAREILAQYMVLIYHMYSIHKYGRSAAGYIGGTYLRFSQVYSIINNSPPPPPPLHKKKKRLELSSFHIGYAKYSSNLHQSHLSIQHRCFFSTTCFFQLSKPIHVGHSCRSAIGGEILWIIHGRKNMLKIWWLILVSWTKPTLKSDLPFNISTFGHLLAFGYVYIIYASCGIQAKVPKHTFDSLWHFLLTSLRFWSCDTDLSKLDIGDP